MRESHQKQEFVSTVRDLKRKQLNLTLESSTKLKSVVTGKKKGIVSSKLLALLLMVLKNLDKRLTLLKTIRPRSVSLTIP